MLHSTFQHRIQRSLPTLFTARLLALLLCLPALQGGLQAQGGKQSTPPRPALMRSVPYDGSRIPNTPVMLQKMKEALRYTTEHGLNSSFCILIDMALHSGSYRCFVVKLPEMKVANMGLVAHGSGETSLPAGQRTYANTPGSLLTSLGKYRTGSMYFGTFGMAYKLYGLDSSNSKAYARNIVLHAHECVPEQEIRYPLCQSWGCPMVSPSFLTTLRSYIESEDKPTLLWIFDSNQ